MRLFNGLFDLARPMLFALEPEAAHEATLRSLEAGLHPRQTGPDDPRLEVNVWGLGFPNPIGIAAGFDKDARVPDAIMRIGFGFAEIGTVTPRAQVGNPTPRVFRLVADRALINRLGFNNGGHQAALTRLARRARSGSIGGIVGVNVGANKDSSDRTADYVAGITTFNNVASYFTVNISSPNTPGLRDLQAPAALDELLTRVMAARAALIAVGQPRRPIIVKIAPDIAEADLPAICERLMAHGVDGIAVANTSLARQGLTDQVKAKEAGGVSGRPVFQRSTAMLARIYTLTGGKLPLIGIGGIDSGETALAKFEAGASLVQLYTGLIYEGPGLIERIKRHLCADLDRRGLASIAAVTGSKAEEWARRPL